MGQDPAAIRQEIEDTRVRMGDTVDALAYKADVPARTRDSINDRVEGVKRRLGGVGGQISDAAPGTEDMRHAGHRAAGIAQENPLGLAIGAAAVGFLAGLALPASRIEDERLGPIADEFRDQARETGQEALERGSQVVQEVAQTAQERAQEAAEDVRDVAQSAAQHHAEELRTSAQENAEEVRRAAQT